MLTAEKRARTFGNGAGEGRDGAVDVRDGSQRGTYSSPCFAASSAQLSRDRAGKEFCLSVL